MMRADVFCTIPASIDSDLTPVNSLSILITSSINFSKIDTWLKNCKGYRNG